MAGLTPCCEYSIRELVYMGRKKQALEWEQTSRIMWAVRTSFGGGNDKPSDFNPFKDMN